MAVPEGVTINWYVCNRLTFFVHFKEDELPSRRSSGPSGAVASEALPLNAMSNFGSDERMYDPKRSAIDALHVRARAVDSFP